MQNYNIGVRRIILLLTAAVLFPLLEAGAQNPNLEKLNNYKIAFFTKKLDLTSSEAEKFWPVYNEYQDKKNLIQIEKIKINRTFNQSGSTLNDNQLSAMGDKYVELLVQESNLAVEFHKKLKEVIPPAKVIRYYQAENQFKAELLNELQNYRQQQKNKPGRNF
jgi:hypothetical protein